MSFSVPDIKAYALSKMEKKDIPQLLPKDLLTDLETGDRTKKWLDIASHDIAQNDYQVKLNHMAHTVAMDVITQRQMRQAQQVYGPGIIASFSGISSGPFWNPR
jgi:hypothetical protein